MTLNTRGAPSVCISVNMVSNKCGHKTLPSTYQTVALVGWNHHVEFPTWEMTYLRGVPSPKLAVSQFRGRSFEGCIRRPIASLRRVKAFLFRRRLQMQPSFPGFEGSTGWILHGPTYPKIHCALECAMKWRRRERKRQLQQITYLMSKHFFILNKVGTILSL